MSDIPARPVWHNFLDLRFLEAGGWRAWGWLTLYPLAWVLLSELSTSLWFLPAALRLAVLWQLPARAWLPVAVLEGVGVLGYHMLGSGTPDLAGLLPATALPWLATAAAVLWSRPRLRKCNSLGSQLPTLLGCAFIAATAGAALVQGATALGLRPALDGSSFQALAQSAFNGMLLLAPLLLALLDHYWQRVASVWKIFLAKGLVLVPGLVLLLVSQLPVEHATAVAMALCMAGLFWLALRRGWRATAVALLVVLPPVVVSQELMDMSMSARMQLLGSASTAALLLLGASTDAVRLQGKALRFGLTQLGQRSSELVDASRRLVSVQEHERRSLGSELHDVLGQDITAIATRLRVVERTTTDPQLREGLHSIGLLVNNAHLHLREVVEHMYPVVLDRFGLARALNEGPLRALARDGGVTFDCETADDLHDLPGEVATSLYRICQEVTSNCVRDEGCTRMRLVLGLDRSANPPRLELSLWDDSGTLGLSDSRLGLGLQTIRDRANALGAEYRFDAQSGEPRHWLSLELEPQASEPATGGP